MGTTDFPCLMDCLFFLGRQLYVITVSSDPELRQGKLPPDIRCCLQERHTAYGKQAKNHVPTRKIPWDVYTRCVEAVNSLGCKTRYLITPLVQKKIIIIHFTRNWKVKICGDTLCHKNIHKTKFWTFKIYLININVKPIFFVFHSLAYIMYI